MIKRGIFLCSILFFLASAQSDYNESATISEDTTSDEQYQPVNIVSIKQDYYKKQGFEVLPDVLTDTTLGPGHFVAINNVTIKKGCAVTLNAGTNLWFEPQKKLIVEGVLIGSSMDNEKIRLTYLPSKSRYLKIAIPDSLWNGIVVEDGGSLLLNRVVISYATVGITVGQGKATLDLACIDMEDNVGVRLNYNGKTINGEDGKCFGMDDIEKGLKADEIAAKNEILKNEKERAIKKRFFWRIATGIVTGSGVGISAFGFYSFGKYKKLYNDSVMPEDLSIYSRKALNGFYAGVAGGVIAFIGATGFTLTFVF